MIKKILSVILMSLTLISCGGSSDTTSESVEENMNKQAYTENNIKYPDELWQTPKTYSFNEIMGVEDYLSNDDVQAVFLKGVNYKGSETRIFGYLGKPKDASSTKKYPGVLLVHGGGGTAYKEWVKQWVDAGYIAFAIDYQGNMPRQNCTIDTQYYDSIPNFVAPKNDSYSDAKEAIENQWMYWATSAAIISNSYLHSLDCIEQDKIGISGISWGSTITTITIGYDARFAFACDIYGCLYNSLNNTYLGNNFVNHPEAIIWDDDKPFINSKVPVLISYYLQDTNFTLNAISKSVLARDNVHLSVHPNWWHSHGGALVVDEPIAFANSIVKNETRLIRITEQPTKQNDLVDYSVPFEAFVSKIELFYTKYSYLDGNTVWESKTINSTMNLSSHLKDDTKNYFVSITDSRGYIISSALVNN